MVSECRERRFRWISVKLDDGLQLSLVTINNEAITRITNVIISSTSRSRVHPCIVNGTDNVSVDSLRRQKLFADHRRLDVHRHLSLQLLT
jgi:hypothetical protein